MYVRLEVISISIYNIYIYSFTVLGGGEGGKGTYNCETNSSSIRNEMDPCVRRYDDEEMKRILRDKTKRNGSVRAAEGIDDDEIVIIIQPQRN